jgi:IS5 family transposase
MFKVLILAAQNNVSDARREYLIRDRLSWFRVLGFDLGAPTPDANKIRLFRERLTKAKAFTVLFDAFDDRLRANGYLAVGGQIIDATLVAAPKQRNTQEEKEAIKAGKTAREVWPDKPAKAAQKDVDARWAVKVAKARTAMSGKPQIDIAIPSFGYKNHIAIDQHFGFIRKSVVTHGARHDGSQLREVITTDNTASDVWPTPLIAQRPMRRGSRHMVGSAASIARSPGANRGQSGCVPPIWLSRNPCAGRTCLCAGKSAHGAVYPDYPHQACRGQDHPRQSGLYYNMKRLIFHERRAATG